MQTSYNNDIKNCNLAKYVIYKIKNVIAKKNITIIFKA